MEECLHVQCTKFGVLARVQDYPRWDSFLEGRISTVFLEVMQPILLDIGLYMAPTKRGQFSIKNLLNITHKQWIFRNSKVHYGRLDGLTKA